MLFYDTIYMIIGSGHYHIEKDLDNIEFIYYQVKELKKDKVYKKVDHNI